MSTRSAFPSGSSPKKRTKIVPSASALNLMPNQTRRQVYPKHRVRCADLELQAISEAMPRSAQRTLLVDLSLNVMQTYCGFRAKFECSFQHGWVSFRDSQTTTVLRWRQHCQPHGDFLFKGSHDLRAGCVAVFSGGKLEWVCEPQGASLRVSSMSQNRRLAPCRSWAAIDSGHTPSGENSVFRCPNRPSSV